MKPIHIVLVIVMAAFSFAMANAQSAWLRQNSLPTGNSLNAVSFTETTSGVAVGDLGTILRTTDAGTTWTNQSSGTTSSLNGIFFSDLKTGSVVGDQGTILRTTDGVPLGSASRAGLQCL